MPTTWSTQDIEDLNHAARRIANAVVDEYPPAQAAVDRYRALCTKRAQWLGEGGFAVEFSAGISVFTPLAAV